MGDVLRKYTLTYNSRAVAKHEISHKPGIMYLVNNWYKKSYVLEELLRLSLLMQQNGNYISINEEVISTKNLQK